MCLNAAHATPLKTSASSAHVRGETIVPRDDGPAFFYRGIERCSSRASFSAHGLCPICSSAKSNLELRRMQTLAAPFQKALQVGSHL